jgi:hypothetical protein
MSSKMDITGRYRCRITLGLFNVMLPYAINILSAKIMTNKERCRLTIGNLPTSGSSMKHFFLKRGPNPKNFCCLGQSSIS